MRGSVQSGPVQSTVQCDCDRQQLHAALTLPICRLKQERERVGKDKGIRGSSVSSRATCCLLGVHCRCPQPVHTPLLAQIPCYGHAASLIWMQQSLGVTKRFLFLMSGRRVVLGRGQGSLAAATAAGGRPPLPATACRPRQTRPDKRPWQRRTTHLIEIKYCEDARPVQQLQAAHAQHGHL